MEDSLESAPASRRTVFPLGKYVVLAELGRGGMAEVYLALSRGPSGFHKLVVLKLLRAHLAEDEEFLGMFMDEARLAARLNHPNIVQTYEVGTEGGRQAIVMEYLEGRSFAEVETATRERGLPLALGIRILADALHGLQHAHDLADLDGRPLKLVHRDVSPHNVMVTYDGQVKVLDFGIAKAADDPEGRTRTGVFKGKVRYTAPERFSNTEFDRRADIFSIGVMLWQLLTGKRAWAKMNDMVVMQQLALGTVPPPPRSIDPNVSAVLDAICNKAIAALPADRYQSASEMADALEDYLASETQGTNRALGKFMTERFGEARAAFQRTVDEQTRQASLLPPPNDESGSLARMRAEAAVPVLGSPASGSLSFLRQSAPPDSASGRVRIATGTGAGTASSLPAPVIASTAPEPASNKRVLAALAAIAIALFLLVGIAMTRTNGVLPDRAAARGAQPAAPLPAPVQNTPIATATTNATATATATPSADTPATTAKPSATAVEKKPSAPPPRVASPPPPARNAKPAAPAAPERPAAPAREPTKEQADCASPYFIDDQGVKKIRPECL